MSIRVPGPRRDVYDTSDVEVVTSTVEGRDFTGGGRTVQSTRMESNII